LLRELRRGERDHDATNVGETAVAFRIGQLLFGLPVDRVQRVIPACKISPLPDAPPVVSGIIRLGSDILPVIDPHKPFNNGTPTPLRISSLFIIVQSPRRRLAVIADQVDGTQVIPKSTLRRAEHLTSGMSLVREVGAAPDDLIYVYDVEHLLAEKDEATLNAALNGLLQ
jgi:purine-binding chemotaxis protein CheW